MGRTEKGRRRLFLFPLSSPSSLSPKCRNSLPRPFHDRLQMIRDDWGQEPIWAPAGDESAPDTKLYDPDDRSSRNRLDRREVYPDHCDHDHKKLSKNI